MATFWANSQVYLISLSILVIILIRITSDNERHFLQHYLFLGLVVSTMVVIGTEAASWTTDGIPGEGARFWGTLLNVFNFIGLVVPLFLWVLYIDFQVHQDTQRFRKMTAFFGGLLVVNAVLSVLSPWGRLYFYLDEANVYHRGDYFWVAMALYFGTLIYAIVLPISHFKELPRRLRWPLILFSVPSVVGVVLQAAFFGVATTWPGIALSLLIVHTSIQNQILSSDYLTGLYNRRQLDNYLYHRIKARGAGATLALLMIDINQFKSINDRFGHIVGDQALESAAGVLRKVFHHEDFIARYAGDEFVVLLDLKDTRDLETVKSRLRAQFELFNATSGQPFELSISVGTAVYNWTERPDPDEFLKQADSAMYRQKFHLDES